MEIENIIGKGENAGYQHLLLFPQCFIKPSFSGSLKVWIVWENVNSTHSTFNSLPNEKNIFGKVENAGYQHFLFFSKYFQKPSSLKVRIV